MRRLRAAPSDLGPGTPLQADAPARGGRSTSARAPIRLWLKVLTTRGKLDRQIAGGPTDRAGDALALRVRQLTSERVRQQVARQLRRIVEHADSHGLAPIISSVIVERMAVRAGREAILGLAERIEGDVPVSAAGIVLARALLTDATSPLHNPYCQQTVTEAVFAVQDALGGRPESGLDLLAA